MPPARQAAQKARSLFAAPADSQEESGWTSEERDSSSFASSSSSSVSIQSEASEMVSEDKLERLKKRRRVDADVAHASPRKSNRAERATMQGSCSRATELARHHCTSYHTALLLSQAALCSAKEIAPPSHGIEDDYVASAKTLGAQTRQALLDWYEGVSAARKMPWRRPFIDPALYVGKESELRELLKRRSYEVLISEIMLQQTRVETVIPYYNRWLSKWPGISALASASPEEVLSMWKGLGYYSRATRLQKAAQLVLSHPTYDGLLPSSMEELCKDVPGVGPYTAGAISCIVFGQPAPMMDGNAYRVYSRQMGLYADMSSKKVLNVLEREARACVEAVAKRDTNGKTLPSKSCGDWGQAIMELGATICTPLRPDCQRCPIRPTCRAYAEGSTLAAVALRPNDETHRSVARFLHSSPAVSEETDIEDLCTLCDPIEEVVSSLPKRQGVMKASSGSAQEKAATNKVQSTLNFGRARTVSNLQQSQHVKPEGTGSNADDQISQQAVDIVRAHVQRFPKKVVKKAPREEACLVLVIRSSEGKVLIEQRAEKGLLAGLWQFPASSLQGEAKDKIEAVEMHKRTTADKKQTIVHAQSTPLTERSAISSKQAMEAEAERLASALLPKSLDFKVARLKARGKITHLFSHIKLHMHVYELTLPTSISQSSLHAAASRCAPNGTAERQEHSRESAPSVYGAGPLPKRAWVSIDELSHCSLSTGNVRCWELSSFAQSAGAPGKRIKR
ncbi:A/G-specific adenine DNA glycosylase [Ceraceosorus bombacis]|uniref:Adenine DNA glycosylase n=1 Tax=Ceraceosorus bombacis TaxID=401625 RepID=A0A0P1BAV0_9BASI|nr:A/G-specific adenine DNA glycosylase [Ceraceosorus bombacis]